MNYANLKFVKYAEEKGMEKGIKRVKIEEIAEGKLEGKKEVALNLLSLGMDVEFVVNATGLEKGIIERLLNFNHSTKKR